ncbi:MAG TPA: hemerythrin domain-containing protein, partial [Methanomicrobiales archaeon]|nr:hemerythrin domain-containing protein [Methanomicrobiales archaeon]
LSTGIEVEETIREFEAFSRDLLGVIQGVENVLYPKVLSDLPERIEEAKRDHNTILILLQELGRPMGGVRVGDEEWIEKLMELDGVVSDHFEREDQNILSRARDLLGSELLQELSFDYEEVKRKSSSEAGSLPIQSAG